LWGHIILVVIRGFEIPRKCWN